MTDANEKVIADLVKAATESLPALQVEAIQKLLDDNSRLTQQVSDSIDDLDSGRIEIKRIGDKFAGAESEIKSLKGELDAIRKMHEDAKKQIAEGQQAVLLAQQQNLLFNYLQGDQKALRDGLINANRFYTQTTQKSHVIDGGQSLIPTQEWNAEAGQFKNETVNNRQEVATVDLKTTTE